MQCYLITLNPQSEQTQTLLTAFGNAGVPVELFAGVDGRKGMPALQAGERLDTRKMLWRHQSIMTSSEVGAYLSHYRVIKTAYEKGLPCVGIFEDDVELEPAFGNIVRELETVADQYDMVRFMGLKIRKRKQVFSFADSQHHIVRPERGLLGTQGYMLNRTGMKKVLDYAGNIFEPIDKVYDHFFEYDLRSFGIEPHVIMEKLHPTTIQKSGRGRLAVPLWAKLLYPLGKGLLSWRRHRFLRLHHEEFYPAEKPRERQGRSPLIR